MNDDEWNDYRFTDGTFRLLDLYRKEYKVEPTNEAALFALDVNAIREIKSRQVAAVVLALMKTM